MQAAQVSTARTSQRRILEFERNAVFRNEDVDAGRGEELLGHRADHRPETRGDGVDLGLGTVFEDSLHRRHVAVVLVLVGDKQHVNVLDGVFPLSEHAGINENAQALFFDEQAAVPVLGNLHR